jgi:hypothetical protein
MTAVQRQMIALEGTVQWENIVNSTWYCKNKKFNARNNMIPALEPDSDCMMKLLVQLRDKVS